MNIETDLKIRVPDHKILLVFRDDFEYWWKETRKEIFARHLEKVYEEGEI